MPTVLVYAGIFGLLLITTYTVVILEGLNRTDYICREAGFEIHTQGRSPRSIPFSRISSVHVSPNALVVKLQGMRRHLVINYWTRSEDSDPVSAIHRQYQRWKQTVGTQIDNAAGNSNPCG